MVLLPLASIAWTPGPPVTHRSSSRAFAPGRSSAWYIPRHQRMIEQIPCLARPGHPNALTTGNQSSPQAPGQRPAQPVCRKDHPCIKRSVLRAPRPPIRKVRLAELPACARFLQLPPGGRPGAGTPGGDMRMPMTGRVNVLGIGPRGPAVAAPWGPSVDSHLTALDIPGDEQRMADAQHEDDRLV
jgi:hypothetical protein